MLEIQYVDSLTQMYVDLFMYTWVTLLGTRAAKTVTFLYVPFFKDYLYSKKT